MRRLLPPALLAAAVLVPGCRSTSEEGPAPPDDLATLTEWMTGTFSSAAQAAADPEHFFDIRLVMVPVWTDRDDGPWLYVEQAAAQSLDKPYRQRVYRLAWREDRTLESLVYTLPGDPLERASCWSESRPLADLAPTDLEERTGCAIHLFRTETGDFMGSTEGRGCQSTLGSAAYATSQVVIDPAGLSSWDRGFDENGLQVWGATEGAYQFDKLAPGPPDAD